MHVADSAAVANPYFHNPLNAFCLTLYSEGAAELAATLEALLTAIEAFHQTDGNQENYSLICIVADGKSRVAPGVLALLDTIGFLDTQLARIDGSDLYSGLHRIEHMLQRLGARNTRAGFEAPTGPMVRGMICLKDSNRGKLHSHKFFFHVLCRSIEPTYCFQIDAGTTLARDAVHVLIERLRSADSIAAIAPRVMPAVPAIEDDLLKSWQYADFAARKGVLWPFEVVTGYLSVLPGQASAFRWSALSGNTKAVTDDGSLNAYLSGVSTSDPLAIVMYLAEDRVIGNQLILSRGRPWRLAFEADAHATTDSCVTYRELFQQRRRWNNGALACRLWLFRQWPEFMRRSDRNLAAKLGLSVAMIGQLLAGMVEWFAPALLIAYLEVVGSALASGGNGAAGPWRWVLAGIVLLEIPFLLRLTRAGQGSIGKALRVFCRVAAPLAFVLMLVSAFAPTTMAILLCPVLALLPMMLVLPARSLPSLARTRLYPLPEMVLANLLYAHAYWNLHDVSWGTKGLRAPTANHSIYSRLRTLRNVVFSAWFVTNLAVGALAIACGGTLPKALNPVVEIGIGIELTLTITALSGLALTKLTGRKKRSARVQSQVDPRPRQRQTMSACDTQ